MPDKKFKVVIIEDDPIYLKLLEQLISNHPINFEIHPLLDSTSAIETIYHIRPDLVITDWEMPDPDGIEICRRIKGNEATRDLPVIICTGINTSSESLKIAFTAGVSDYIRKPVDMFEFNARVNSAITLSESFKTIRQKNVEIERERTKSDHLLHSILPRKIARDLKEKGVSKPEVFEDVTIFISDFVGFTRKSTELTAHQVINELNDMFTYFDIIMETEGCERIKTVGDAYFAVCGMPQEDPEHAIKIISAATRILEYIKNRNQENDLNWEVRIGVHSGRVAGGIVGTTKYVYDVFGDSINIASRLEKKSKPMEILISEDTKKLCGNKISIREKRVISVKGIGEINAYSIQI